MSRNHVKPPLVSAIVSCYNAERFLAGRLEDLEAQSIACDLEIIVINSGSQQDEGRIVEEFQGRYRNIRYLRTARRETVYQAWNRGLREAKGEFVTNANTDDRLRHDCLEVLVHALREHPECVLAYPDMRITGEENATFQAHAPLGFRQWPDYDRNYLLEICCIGPFPLWRRTLHGEIGYFDERFKSAADYEFWLRASEHHDFIHVPEFLGLYWLNPGTVSRLGELPTLEYLQVQKEYRERFAPLTPPPLPLPPGEKERFQALRERFPEGSAQGVPEFKAFCELHPGFPGGHHHLAGLYVRNGEIGLAKMHFEKASLLDPSSRQFSGALTGFLRMELFQPLKGYTLAASANPADPEHLLCAGMICILLERYPAARGHYLRVLELEPENILARENLAALERSTRKEAPHSEAPGYYGFSRPELQRLVSRASRRILDIGCGFGRVAAALKARQGGEVWGVECDPPSAARAREVLDRVIEAPIAEALGELPPGYFDTIVLGDILEHLADPKAALEAIAEKLAPTGEIVVSLPNVGHWSVLQGLLEGDWHYEEAGILDRTHLRFFTRSSALALFEEAGFSTTSVTPVKLSGDLGIPNRLFVALQEGGIIPPTFLSQCSAYQYLFRLVRPDTLLTSIVMLTYNELSCTRECLESIGRNTPEPHEVILVDNGSTDGTLDFLRELCAHKSRYRLLENGGNLGFARGCNLGMRAACGGRILLLNNDTVVTPGWLGAMTDCLTREPGAGIVGPMSGEVAGPQRVAPPHYKNVAELEEFARSFASRNRGRRIRVEKVVGFCMLFTRELFTRIGELDPGFGTGNFEDDDFCLRAALDGFACVIAGDVFIHHYGSRSFKANSIDYAKAMAVNREFFDAKWHLARLAEPLAQRLITRNAITEGVRLARKGRLGEAIGLLLQQGIKFSPQTVAPYLALAGVLVEAGSFRDALELIGEIPGDGGVPALLFHGSSLSGQDRLDEAEVLAQEALERDPDSSGALHLKGELAVKGGELAAAETFFRDGIAADPGFGPNYTALSGILWERGERDQGVLLAEIGFVLSPLSTLALNRFHRHAAQSQMLSQEEERVREARAIFPEHRGLAFGLIEILIRRALFPEAMAAIEEAAVTFGLDDAMIDASLDIRKRIGPIGAGMGERAAVSLCMIVKDEAGYLPGLLLSVRGLVDEMVVVDTGSSDRTADIARIFGARLFTLPWEKDFAKARNFSLSQATGNWILVLDADELLAPGDLPPLKGLIARTVTPTAFSFTTRNYTSQVTRKNWTPNLRRYPDEERGRGWTPSDKVRLFPNDRRLAFEGAVHELLEPSLALAGIPIHACDVPVHHYGSLDAVKSRLKQEQYYLLGVKKLSETPADPASLIELATQATELQRIPEATALWGKLLEARPESPEAHFSLGYLHLLAGEYQAARGYALRGVELAPGVKEALFNLAKCELFLGKPAEALACCQSLLATWPDYPPALSLYSAASLILGLRGEGEKVMERIALMGFDCRDYLMEYTAGLTRGGRGDLALPLLSAADRLSQRSPAGAGSAFGASHDS